MSKIIRIGTRESQLAVWQATLVQNLLKDTGLTSELVYIKSEGDVDTVTPLYALGVTGVFTKTLDAALLANRIDIAVHSMKDVPTQLAKGIRQAAVLKRASFKDIFVAHPDLPDGKATSSQSPLSRKFNIDFSSVKNELLRRSQAPVLEEFGQAIIATSSIRRIAQWLNRYPGHAIENLRGNVNTRLRKLAESNWHGAIFAAAGLERINLRPAKSIDLDWMLPAPAQGAIMIVCREDDEFAYETCNALDDAKTALCTKMEREFLNSLMGGCSTPISALAEVQNEKVFFRGNICSTDGKIKVELSKEIDMSKAETAGVRLANELLQQPSASKIVQDIRYAKK